MYPLKRNLIPCDYQKSSKLEREQTNYYIQGESNKTLHKEIKHKIKNFVDKKNKQVCLIEYGIYMTKLLRSRQKKKATKIKNKQKKKVSPEFSRSYPGSNFHM